MTEFVSGITSLISGIFQAFINAAGSLGNLIFNTAAETGNITGLTSFGWLFAIVIGIPLATWLFNKLFSWIRTAVAARGR